MDAKKLKSLKEKHDLSNIKAMATTGKRYYRSKNDITRRKMYIYTENGLIEDIYKANNKIACAYSKLLIDQLINYLLGQKPIQPVEDNDFVKQLPHVASNARIKGQQWVQAYVENGEFKTMQIPTEELLPIYRGEELEAMFRFCTVNGDDYIYMYTKDEVVTYDEKFKEIDRRPVMQWRIMEGATEVIESDSLGVVPFVCMKANNECVYDLEPIKPLIDSYDLVLSDFANNLEDFQDVTWILKGYSGQNVSEFTNQVKMFKSIPVSSDGDARPETIDIPHDARMAMLEKSENLIFKFGFGVNLDSLAGSSLTNVAIKAQFANLDMKANMFSQEVTKFIEDYIALYNVWASKANKELIQSDEITYNKTTIVNEVELLKANAEQYSFISEETRLTNHPWVPDVSEEMARLESRLTIPDGQEE